MINNKPVIIREDFYLELRQEHQVKELSFALLYEENDCFINIMPLVICRDYFNDISHVQNAGEGSECTIYGFQWAFNGDFKTQTEDTGTINLLLSFGSREDKDHFYKNSHIRKEIEDMFMMKTSILHEVKDHGHSLRIEMDSKWLYNGVIMSLYTLILRLTSYNLLGYTNIRELGEAIKAAIDGNDTVHDIYWCPDGHSLLGLSDNLEVLERLGGIWKDVIGKTPYLECDKYEWHNGGGIQSFLDGYLLHDEDPDYDEDYEPAVVSFVRNFVEYKL